MIRDITIGQYYPGDSWIHKLDPRVKILGTLLYIVSLFLVKDFLGFGIALAFLFFTIHRTLNSCNNYWEVNLNGIEG